MPELPEVESVAREMRQADPPVIGSAVRSVEVAWDGVVKDATVAAFCEAVIGSRIVSVSRHGKYLFFGLAKAGPAIYLAMHLRMTGIAYLNSSSQPAAAHNRLSLHLDSGLALRFDDPRKFGRVWLVGDMTAVTAGLGPDALTIGAEEFIGRFRAISRQLKPLLLDQSFVAGIGNIYADESLFLAGLNPLQKSSRLTDAQIRRLHQSVAAVLEEAVSNDGANIDGVFKAGNYKVRVYGREGKPCLNCGGYIVKIRVGQRGTHYCPVCQPIHDK